MAVGSAYGGDRNGLRVLMSRFCNVFFKLKLIWSDAGYNGAEMEEDLSYMGVRQEVIGGIKPKRKGFLVDPKRWIVERTFAWLGRFRRLSKDYEYYPSTSESMIYLAMSRLMVKRIARIC